MRVEMRIPTNVIVMRAIPDHSHCQQCGKPAVVRVGRINEPVAYFCELHGRPRAERLIGEPLPADYFR
jgi:hypothetical protein